MAGCTKYYLCESRFAGSTKTLHRAAGKQRADLFVIQDRQGQPSASSASCPVPAPSLSREQIRCLQVWMPHQSIVVPTLVVTKQKHNIRLCSENRLTA